MSKVLLPTLAIVFALTGCESPDPLVPAAVAACDALELAAGEISLLNSPSAVVSGAVAELDLSTDQARELQLRVAMEECPEVHAARVAEYDELNAADRRALRQRRADQERSVVDGYLSEVAQDYFDADQREALLTIADTYCKSGVGKNVPLDLLTVGAVDGIDAIGEWAKNQYALPEFVPDWERRPDALAAIQELPRVEGSNRLDTRVSSSSWSDAARRYCRGTGQLDY